MCGVSLLVRSMASSRDKFIQKLVYELLVVGFGFGQPVAKPVEEHEVGGAVHPVVLPGVARLAPERCERDALFGHEFLRDLEGADAADPDDGEPVGVLPSEPLDTRGFFPARLSEW